MAHTDRYTRHARLVSKMADRIGLDLVEAMQRGQVDSEDLRGMVNRCAGCTNPEACSDLLADGHTHGVAPEYCRNAHIFEALRP